MSKRKTAEDYRKLAESKGFVWVGGKFPKDVRTKTKWQCSKGHQWITIYGSIQAGSGCPHCSHKARKIPNDYYMLALGRGFKWLGPKVSNNQTLTFWECEKGHRWQAIYSNIAGGRGCPHCVGCIQKIPADYHNLAIKQGFKWRGPKVPNNQKKTTWECEKGHQWQTTYGSIQQGSGCPRCAAIQNSVRMKKLWASGVMDRVQNSPSSIEIEVRKALDALGIDHQFQYRPNGYSQIYDEFIPPNILVEINGDYWHGNPLVYAEKELNETQYTHKKRDARKIAWAEENDCKLVILWENEIKTHGARLLIEERILPLLNN